MPERIFRIGHSGHTRKSSSHSYTHTLHEPPRAFYISAEYYKVSRAIWCRWLRKGLSRSLRLQKPAAHSPSPWISTGCSRGHYKNIPFVRTIGAFYMRFAAYHWLGARYCGFSGDVCRKRRRPRPFISGDTAKTEGTRCLLGNFNDSLRRPPIVIRPLAQCNNAAARRRRYFS